MTASVITYKEAAELAGRNTSTIYRWVKHGHIRVGLLPDRTGYGVSRADIEAMKTKRWTRRPRHTWKGA